MMKKTGGRKSRWTVPLCDSTQNMRIESEKASKIVQSWEKVYPHGIELSEQCRLENLVRLYLNCKIFTYLCVI